MEKYGYVPSKTSLIKLSGPNLYVVATSKLK